MSFYHYPIPEGEYDRRYLDQELRNVSDETEFVDDRLDLMELLWKLQEAVGVEHAVIRGSTTLQGVSPNEFLVDYTGSWKPSPPRLSALPQLIATDTALGTITVGYDGIYRISAYVAYTIAQGVENIWAVDFSVGTVSQGVIGADVGSNQSSGTVTSASFLIALLAGTEIRFGEITTGGTGVISGSDLEVELISLDGFV